MLGRPVAAHLVGLLMTRVAVFQSFSHKLIQLGRQTVDVRNARRAGSHILLGVLLELVEVKVVAAGLTSRGALHGSFGHNKHGQAWRQGPSFLGAGQQDVDAESVEV